MNEKKTTKSKGVEKFQDDEGWHFLACIIE
jgi:hypothetical protein